MLKISRNWFNRSRLSLLSWLGVAGVGSCFALILTLGVMLFPSLPDSVQAVNTDGGGQHSGGSGADEGTDTISTSVSIGIPSAIAFDAVTPTTSGATTTANANLTITTTNSASYSLYLYSSDGDNSLKSINPANTSTVDAINNGGVGLTLSSLESNTWGYNLGTSDPTADTTYNAVPTSNDTPIQTKDTSSTNSANDTYTLSFGAKVDTSIPSGTYTGTLTVAVVAEPSWVVIDYDANGGYFNGDSSQTTNSVVYSVDKLPVVTANKSGSGSYGETITVPDATSLSVKYSCSVWDTFSIGFVVLNSHYICSGNTAESGTLTLLGDTVEISAYADVDYSYDLTISGAKVTIISGDEELVPVRPGYTFLGWYKDANLDTNNEFIAVDATTSSGTIYAKWFKNLTVIFDGNGNTGGSMANQEVVYGDNILNTNKYTKSGYRFIRWNTEADGSGTSYGDNASYSYTNSIGSDTLTLYAQWGQDVGAIQNFTKSQCQSLASDTEVVAIDLRDNNTYSLRYINGNCWMTQNLRLSGGRTLTPSDSNVASNWSFPSTELAGNSYTYTEPQMTISSDTSYGGYYNFCAASAGTLCDNTTAQNATYDICPAGWRLPTKTEFDSINGTSYVSAFSPTLSGYYYGSSLGSIGRNSWWWSATQSYAKQYLLEYDNNELDTSAYGFDRFRGYSIRCIRSS